MTGVDVLLLLGSNVGNRFRHLRRAVTDIRRWDGIVVSAVSTIHETAAVGPSRRPYFNQAVRLRTTRSPMGLLLEAKILEASAGRAIAPRWTARPLDVDIVAFGRKKSKTAWLTLPHARMASRRFALAPLAEIAPEWRLDGKRTIRTLLAALDRCP